jgi:hypothetical protein
MQASWEAGRAKARAAASAANDPCRFAIASSFHGDPIRHTLTYTGHVVCATPESIADYDRRGQVIADLCGAGSCWRNAEETQFTPGVCGQYERLATRSGQGRLGGSHRVNVKELHLVESQKHGAIVKGDKVYTSQGSALDAYEMFALEAHVRCQEWYRELAQEREREEKARQEATRRERERERAQAAAAQAQYEASGQRETEQICEAWSVEALMQQQIDRDKEAEAISGIVNLATRHKAANTIVFMREQRKTATAAYRKKTGKSFNLAQCQ